MARTMVAGDERLTSAEEAREELDPRERAIRDLLGDSDCEEVDDPQVTRKQREVGPAIRREVAKRWPEGVIPPTEGGRFFRRMSDELGCPEYVLSKLGQAEGWWPWTPGQVVRAFEKREREQRKERRQAKRGEQKETWLPVFGWV